MYASDKLYPKSVYQFYTYLFVALILLIFIAVYYFTYNNSSETEKESKPSFKIPSRAVMHIAVMAIALFLGTYTQTIAATDYGMPSQILYPVVKGACLITVSINATLFFGERFTSRSVIGSLVALGGIVCMNVL